MIRWIFGPRQTNPIIQDNTQVYQRSNLWNSSPDLTSKKRYAIRDETKRNWTRIDKQRKLQIEKLQTETRENWAHHGWIKPISKQESCWNEEAEEDIFFGRQKSMERIWLLFFSSLFLLSSFSSALFVSYPNIFPILLYRSVSHLLTFVCSLIKWIRKHFFCFFFLETN